MPTQHEKGLAKIVNYSAHKAHKFSKLYLLLFIVIFGGLGTYLLWFGHAATTTITGASLAVCNPSPCTNGTTTSYNLPTPPNSPNPAIQNYEVYRPGGLAASPSNKVPAVLVFGGAGYACGAGSATGKMAGNIANTNRIIVVKVEIPCNRPAPDALNWIKQDVNSATPTVPSDEPAVTAIVNAITQCPSSGATSNQCVDPLRIYAEGASSGGNMAADIMCNTVNSPLFRGYEIDSSSLHIYNPAPNQPNCPSTNKNFFVMMALSNQSADASIYNGTAPLLSPQAFTTWVGNRLGCSGSYATGTIFQTTTTYSYSGCGFAVAGSRQVETLGIVNGGHTWFCQDSDATATPNSCTAIGTPQGLVNGLPLTHGLFVDQEFWNLVAAGTSGSGSITPPPPTTDTTPPSTSITTPTNAGSVSGTATITANAADNIGVVKVEFYVDGSLKSTATTSPYTYSWNTSSLSNGTHTLQTKAYDAAGNVGSSSTVSVSVSNSGTPLPPPTTGSAPPPSGGYFQLVAPGGFNGLPSDTSAAQMVHYSAWEPRSANYAANHSVPPSSFTTYGDDAFTTHRAALFGRVTGNFTGTTDEIIQWVAAKWGLSDEIMRAEAVWEGSWYQNHKTSAGQPISGNGYGDFGSCSGQPGGPGSPAPSGYGATGPSSFGLMQDKWCVYRPYNPSSSDYDGWPWSENSTAYSVDLYGAIIRGCYEGWDTWAGSHANDIWGCVGAWYSGRWYDSGANSYIAKVQGFLNTKPWLTWPDQSGSIPTPQNPPPDTTPPSIKLTLPPANASLNGSTTISAIATDNVAVANVQFQVDNSNVGSPVTSSPYVYVLNTTGLSNGSHTLTAVATDTSRNSASSSVSVFVTNTTTPKPPAVPQGLNGSTANNVVTLNWSASTPGSNSLVGYYIVRGGVTIGSSTTTSYTDSTVSAGQTYSYQVMAYDNLGQTSGLSSATSLSTPTATTPDSQPPTTPTNLSAQVVSTSQINLGWIASSDNVGVTGYNVYRDGIKLASVTTTTFGDTGLAAGTRHLYYVTAHDAAGNISGASTTVTATTQSSPVVTGISETGNVAGKVRSVSGKSLAGVRISTVYNRGTHYFTTNTEGHYTAVNIPAGVHTFRFSKDYYNSVSQSVTVHSKQTSTLNVTLTELRKV